MKAAPGASFRRVLRPVAVFQHEADAPPAFFAAWLQEQRLPYRLFRVDLGDPVPAQPHAFSGLCFMGGAMSVNDLLPWIEDECALIRAAVAARVPVIGHCLGGQLLAKALGGAVTRNAVREIGWHRLQIVDAEVARDWLGDDGMAEAERADWFQWHGETFALPPGARNFLASAVCRHQAYVVERDGCAHLGMQFHCEMSPELVTEWALGESGREEIANEIAANGGAGVQAPEAIAVGAGPRTARLNALAARLYARWARGLVVD